MSDLHIVVCMKVVPKSEEIRVDPETWRLIREGARSEINPPDMNALEMALSLKDQHGGRINLLSIHYKFRRFQILMDVVTNSLDGEAITGD